MANIYAIDYPFRQKMDGSSDSICLNCLATITSTAREPGPESHICEATLAAGSRTHTSHSESLKTRSA